MANEGLGEDQVLSQQENKGTEQRTTTLWQSHHNMFHLAKRGL